MHSLLLALALSGIGTDAAMTQHIWSIPRPIEYNAVARPFVSHGTPLRAAYFGTSAAGFVVLDHQLVHHHRKLAFALDAAVIGAEIYCNDLTARKGRF